MKLFLQKRFFVFLIKHCLIPKLNLIVISIAINNNDPTLLYRDGIIKLSNLEVSTVKQEVDKFKVLQSLCSITRIELDGIPRAQTSVTRVNKYFYMW